VHNPTHWLRLNTLTGTNANNWHSQPWKTSDGDGIYRAANNDVWVYRVLPLSSIEFEDPETRLTNLSAFDRLLRELGDTTRDLGQGMSIAAQRRDIHILALLYETPSEPDREVSDQLAALQQQMLYHTTTNKLFTIGVKLRRDAVAALTNSDSDDSLAQRVKAVVKPANDMASYTADYTRITSLLARASGRTPTSDEAAWMQSWFNSGKGTDTRIDSTDTRLRVGDGTSWQISALWSVDEQDMQLASPSSAWAMDAMNHPAGANVISIRSELEPATVTRGRSRKSQRILRSQQEEELATGDISRDEITDKAATAKKIENYIRESGAAWLSNTSVLFARSMEGPGQPPPDETFADTLSAWYGFNIKPLEKRQLSALAEMLPGSSTRVNPFGQDVNTAWVAYSGLQGFGKLGDSNGLLLAEASPHSTPVRVNEHGAARENAGPAFCIFGRPGSGKTFAAQLLAGQAALNGGTSIFINPKGHDSLAPFAHWIRQQGAPATIVSLSALAQEGGAFDPFRIAAPAMAAEILTNHILNILDPMYGSGLSGAQAIELKAGLMRGAQAGARCAHDAMKHVNDDSVRTLVDQLARSSPLFQLGYGYTPAVAWGSRSGYTLIEFDRALDWPAAGKDSAGYSMPEREAVGALRLISRASIEILMRSGGGTLVVDEAHHFLASNEGRSALDRLNREGRSLGLLPIFCTQQVTDLIGGSVDMETYLSRVLALRLPDKAQATAALTLCGLEPTEARISWLRASAPGVGFFRDLQDRHGIVRTGAGISEAMYLAMSTNKDDRARRQLAEADTWAATDRSEHVAA